MTKQLLLAEAQRARCVFENHNNGICLEYFGGFPFNVCGNVCEFLGGRLLQIGINNVRCIYGAKLDGGTHAWLEVGDLIIDITSDQFSDGLGKVYVDNDRSFHDCFEDQYEGIIGLHVELNEDFKIFCTLMNNVQPYGLNKLGSE